MLQRTDKRFLYNIIGISRAAGQSITETPQQAPVGLEDVRECNWLIHY
jgi:hypothetical protein